MLLFQPDIKYWLLSLGWHEFMSKVKIDLWNLLDDPTVELKKMSWIFIFFVISRFYSLISFKFFFSVTIECFFKNERQTKHIFESSMFVRSMICDCFYEHHDSFYMHVYVCIRWRRDENVIFTFSLFDKEKKLCCFVQG